MRPLRMFRPLSLALLGLLSLPAFAESWSSFENTFSALPCQDGWAACVVDGVASGPGAMKDAAGRPLAADARFGWFDLKPTQNISPFATLSAYIGTIGGEVPAPVEARPVAASGRVPDSPQPVEDRPVADNANTGSAAASSGGSTATGSNVSSTSMASNTTATSAQTTTSGGGMRPSGTTTTPSSTAATPSSTAATPSSTTATPTTATPTTATPTTATPATATPATSTGGMRPSSTATTTTTSIPASTTTSTIAPTNGTAKTVSSTPTTAATNAAVAPVASGAQDDGCGDLVKLEPAAMMGQLRVGQNKCLEGRVGSESQQTTKDKISRLMITNAEAKGDKTDWERLMKRHLEDIDRSDPDLCFKYALHLSRGGAARAQGVIRWADYALENKSKWSGQTYKTRAFSLYKLRAEAANRLWQEAEKDFAEGERSDDKEAKAARYRGQSKDYAREWLDYAKASEQETKTAMALCVSSSGNRAFCEGG